MRLRQIRRRSTNDHAEISKIVQAARLFQKGLQQKDIAEQLEISPATVSRMLDQAHRDRILVYRVVPPPITNLKERLEDILPGILTEVVPDSGDDSEKNKENLGVAGAQLLLKAVLSVSKAKTQNDPIAPITMVLACGETVLSVIQEFLNELQDFYNDGNSIPQELHVYPSTLFGGAERAEMNPHRILDPTNSVGYFDTATKVLVPSLTVKSYPYKLVPKFYKDGAEQRAAFLETYNLTTFVDTIRRADIFLLGCGSVNHSNYKAVMEILHEKADFPDCEKMAEIAYIPIKPDGKPYEPIADKLSNTGISIDDLIGISKEEGKHVIVVAGGVSKRKILPTAFKYPCYNTLVTDAGAVEEWLRVRSCGAQS